MVARYYSSGDRHVDFRGTWRYSGPCDSCLKFKYYKRQPLTLFILTIFIILISPMTKRFNLAVSL